MNPAEGTLINTSTYICLTTGEGVHLLEMKNFDFNFIFTKSSEMIMGF